jgi:hypothetical protein
MEVKEYLCALKRNKIKSRLSIFGANSEVTKRN